MKSQWKTRDTTFPSGKGSAEHPGASLGARDQTKMFNSNSRREKPPCISFSSSFITLPSGEGFYFSHQFISNLRLEHKPTEGAGAGNRWRSHSGS